MDPEMVPLDNVAPVHLEAPPSRLPSARGTIRSFSEALAVLKAHTFQTNDLAAAARNALSLHARTFEVVNIADISNLQAARASLHPANNFLAYISTLHAALAVVEHDSPLVPALLSDWRALVSSIDPNWARGAHLRWVGAVRHVARLAIDSTDPCRALSLVRPLHDAAEKLATRPDALVPIQADFLAVCLQAKTYSLAAQWIRKHRRLYADVSTSGVSASDVHLIYHYAALVLIGVKDFRAALQSCRLALAVPAPTPGAFFNVAMCTFRTFVLVHLLVTGKSPPPLKFSSYPSGGMRKFGSEYMELAYAFEKLDIAQTRQIYESNVDLFEKHGTHGLVKQVMASLSKQSILRLADSYVTLRLEDVASKAGLESEEAAHAALLEMIEAKKINACIDEREKMVRLLDNDLVQEERIAAHVSNACMSHCLEIVRRIEDFRENLECDPDFVSRELAGQQQQQSRRGQAGMSALGVEGGGSSLAITELESDI